MKKYAIGISSLCIILWLLSLSLSSDRVYRLTYTSNSMEPSIPKNAVVTWEKMGDIRITRGDLVVYYPPEHNGYVAKKNEVYVSRATGIQGDVIFFNDEYIGVNNYVFRSDEARYINNKLEVISEITGKLSVPGELIFLKENEVFLVSDNWKNAVDSRIFGKIDTSRIVGKVIEIEAP